MNSPLELVRSEIETVGPAPGEERALRLRNVNIDTPAAKFDLTLAATETADGIGGYLEYAVDLFDPDSAERLLDRGAVGAVELTRQLVARGGGAAGAVLAAHRAAARGTVEGAVRRLATAHVAAAERTGELAAGGAAAHEVTADAFTGERAVVTVTRTRLTHAALTVARSADGRSRINRGSNNYLGLADHPDMVAAAKSA